MEVSYLHRVLRETKELRDAISHTIGIYNPLFLQANQLYESIAAMVVLAEQEAAARFKREYRDGKYSDGVTIDGEAHEVHTHRRLR